MMLLVTESDHDELARIASLSGLESDLLRGPGITRWLDRRARSLGLDERSHRDADRIRGGASHSLRADRGA